MPATRAAQSPTAAQADHADDALLMERARAGDVDAFATLYDRHAPVLLGLCMRMRLSESEAHDLLQDVFIEAWQAVRSYDPQRAAVRTWLVVRARSRALDRIKRRQRAQHAHQQLQRSAERASEERSPQTELAMAVRDALDTLGAEARTTLELVYYEGLTAAEVSQRMEVPEGTVKSRLARGLRALGRLLGDDGKTTTEDET